MSVIELARLRSQSMIFHHAKFDLLRLTEKKTVNRASSLDLNDFNWATDGFYSYFKIVSNVAVFA